MKKISIDPITRLEGHGRIDILLDDAGEVANCLLVIPELRGFEKFVEGRPVEEVPRIASCICGVCPEAHLAAGTKAVEAAYGLTIPPAAEVIRRLEYNAFVAGDHATHFYALGGPDFIIGPDADPSERNVIGVLRKVGADVAGKVLRMRREAHEVARTLGGKPVHPVGMIAGGHSMAVTPEMRRRFIDIGEFMVEFALFTQKVFADLVLANPRYLDLIRSETFSHRTYYMSLVNDKNQVDVYDGAVRVVDPDGRELCRYRPEDYLDHVAERVETWSYLKFPYLKAVGWKGLVDGKGSGVYRSAPLGMLNAAEGMQTPLAQEEYEKFFAAFGGKPVHATLAYHWARIIEMLQAAELVLRHARDERLTDPEVRALPGRAPTEGVGVVEAPRGLLTHHYVTDERGMVTRANLIVGTTNNYAPITLSVKKAAQSLIRGGSSVSEAALNTIEMAFRAYDPCFGCATHMLAGARPLETRVLGADGRELDVLSRGGRGRGGRR